MKSIGLALSAGCSLSWAASAQPVPAQPVDFRDSTCLAVKFDQGQPMDQLPMVSELGVGWVREGALWREIEPEAGVYVDFSPAFKKRLAYYRDHNIGIIYPLVYANEKAYPPTPEEPFRGMDPKALGRYAVQVSRMLRKEGVRFVLQVWNEPHNFVLKKSIGGEWNGKPPSPWVQHYARMVDEVVAQVKADDPSIKVLTNEDMWVLHYRFLEAGLPKALDGFSIHPYVKKVWGPEITGPGFDSDWTRPFSVVDRDRSYSSAVRRLREEGERKLGKTPEIWATEWGWKLGEPMAAGPVDENMLAGLLPRSFIVSAAAQVRTLCWFSAQDRKDGPMGLLANDGKRRAPYQSFKVMSEQLGTSRLVKQVLGGDRLTSGPQAFLFQGPKGNKLVLWDVEGAQRSLPLTGALRGAKAVDTFGNPLQAVANDGAADHLFFSSHPIYVTLPSSAQSLDEGLKDALKELQR